jgi:hypothetical protein
MKPGKQHLFSIHPRFTFNSPWGESKREFEGKTSLQFPKFTPGSPPEGESKDLRIVNKYSIKNTLSLLIHLFTPMCARGVCVCVYGGGGESKRFRYFPANKSRDGTRTRRVIRKTFFPTPTN